MTKRINKFSTFVLSLMTVCVPFVCLADPHYMPLRSRLDIGVNWTQFGFGDLDVMVPAYGDMNRIVYFNGYTKVHNSQEWNGSVGIGYREIFNNAIYGAYIFGEQNIYDPGHYPVISPGIEFMTNNWDAHLNAYFVLGAHDDVVRNYQFNYLRYNFDTYYTLYQRSFQLRQHVGSGVDAIIGYTATDAKRARIFGGGYFYGLNGSENVGGVVGGIEFPITTPKFVLGIMDSYDNIFENTALLFLRVSIGGLCKPDIAVIQDRMVDRLPRHLGAISNGSGLPVAREYTTPVDTILVRNFSIISPPPFVTLPTG